MKESQVKGKYSERVKVDCFPAVCDVFLPKLRAIESAHNLASSLLRISFSVSEKNQIKLLWFELYSARTLFSHEVMSYYYVSHECRADQHPAVSKSP